MAVDLSFQGENLEIGASRPLFGEQAAPERFWIAPDGQRMLGLVSIEGANGAPLTLVTNWASALRPR
jgi:hypothetical protein